MRITAAEIVKYCCAQSNLEEVLNFELSNDDYNRISAIDFQLRLVDGIRFLRPEGPYRSDTLLLL